MNHLTLCHEFNIRYYRWRLLEAYREAKSDFSFLSKMHSRYIRVTLEAIYSFSRQEQLKLLPAVVKMASQNINVADDKISREEEILLSKLKTKESNILRSPDVNIQEKKLKKIKKEKLKIFIQEALLEFFDVNFIPCGSGFYFNCHVQDWVIKTFLEIEDGYYYYSHQIYLTKKSSDYEVRLGPPTINLSSWLGLNSRPWCFFQDEDAPFNSPDSFYQRWRKKLSNA